MSVCHKLVLSFPLCSCLYDKILRDTIAYAYCLNTYVRMFSYQADYLIFVVHLPICHKKYYFVISRYVYGCFTNDFIEWSINLSTTHICVKLRYLSLSTY